MSTYTTAELEEAFASIQSTIRKCEKALPKLKKNSAQSTLLTRRIKALVISAELIEIELAKISDQKN